MIKELRLDYRKCFTNSALSSTAKRFSPTTLQSEISEVGGRAFEPKCLVPKASIGLKTRGGRRSPTRGFSVLLPYRDYVSLSVAICIYSTV